MTKTRRINSNPLFGNPFFVGFDSLPDKLYQSNTTYNTNYPPYNLYKTSDTEYTIEFAVAGFSEDQLSVTIEQSYLYVSGDLKNTNSDTIKDNYIYKGIAQRAFKHKFTLADTVVVESASLENGILTVKLRNVIPESKKPKKIEINRQSKQFLSE